MKKYTAPKIEISRFCIEDIITESAAGLTAAAQVEKSLTDSGATETYTMIWQDK